MIILKNDDEIEMMRISGRVTGSILYELRELIRPGISTMDIDRYTEGRIRSEGMIPSFKGYNDYPASACVSVNHEIVHGIPDEDRILEEGDIVSVDIGATYDGWVSDAARTYPVGNVSEEARRIIEVCRASFFGCLRYCIEGCRLTDIGHSIQRRAESAGYSVVRDFVGHGIGRDMHEDPQIKNYGPPGKGPQLLRGMALAIEPMINEGDYETEVLANNWTAVTSDGKLSAHYENTVIITGGEPEVITLDERDERGA
ncbi:MAG: type I methionyl aminopeptidase [Clostridiales Family XIII bacterium]|jgi:methionyl aminopeptidase|nr:type I methionyl aminopeptidase [Clostridiales Family XIII bacterium]